MLVTAEYIKNRSKSLEQTMFVAVNDLKQKIVVTTDNYRLLLENKINLRYQKFKNFVDEQQKKLIELWCVGDNDFIIMADYLQSNLIKPAETKINNLIWEIGNDLDSYKNGNSGQKNKNLNSLSVEVADYLQRLQKINNHIQRMIKQHEKEGEKTDD